MVSKARLAVRKPPSPRVLSWFRNSATILVARVTAFSGFVLAVLSGLDWTTLIGINPADRKTSAYIGLVVLAHGLVTEMARRRTLDA